MTLNYFGTLVSRTYLARRMRMCWKKGGVYSHELEWIPVVRDGSSPLVGVEFDDMIVRSDPKLWSGTVSMATSYCGNGSLYPCKKSLMWDLPWLDMGIAPKKLNKGIFELALRIHLQGLQYRVPKIFPSPPKICLQGTLYERDVNIPPQRLDSSINGDILNNNLLALGMEDRIQTENSNPGFLPERLI